LAGCEQNDRPNESWSGEIGKRKFTTSNQRASSLLIKQQGVLAGHILTIQAIFARHPEAADSSTVRPGCEAVFLPATLGAVHGFGDQASLAISL
jgi:hypothetical protein